MTPPRRPRLDTDLAALGPVRQPGREVDRLAADAAGLFALVDQLRRIRALTTGGLFDTDLGPLVERVRTLADELEAASATPAQRQAATWARSDYAANCPVIGRANLLAPPIAFTLSDDGVLRGEVTLGLEYQGPPACVHGGVVSLLFDVVLGRANFHTGATGMTVSLDVDYRSPTPVLEPLVLTGRQVAVEGRSIRSEGALWADDRLCATAVGVFVHPGEVLREKKRALLGGR